MLAKRRIISAAVRVKKEMISITNMIGPNGPGSPLGIKALKSPRAPPRRTVAANANAKKINASAPVTLMLPVAHEKSGINPNKFAIRMKRKSVQKKGMNPRPRPLPPKFGSTISSRMKTTYFSINNPKPLGTRPIFRRATTASAINTATTTKSITASKWKIASPWCPNEESQSACVPASGVPQWCNT